MEGRTIVDGNVLLPMSDTGCLFISVDGEQGQEVAVSLLEAAGCCSVNRVLGLVAFGLIFPAPLTFL